VRELLRELVGIGGEDLGDGQAEDVRERLVRAHVAVLAGRDDAEARGRGLDEDVEPRLELVGPELGRRGAKQQRLGVDGLRIGAGHCSSTVIPGGDKST
jgi:hypothetical protein